MGHTPERVIDSFIEECSQLLAQYGSAIEDLQLLDQLRKNKEFIKENQHVSDVYFNLEFILTELVKVVGAKKLRVVFALIWKTILDFVTKWRTPPIKPFMFDLNLSNPEYSVKRVLEKGLRSLGKVKTITVYPWTKREEVLNEWRRIKGEIGSWRIVSPNPVIPIVISELKDNGNHKYPEIAEWINNIRNEQIEDEHKRREKELRGQGLKEVEIDEILDREFSPDNHQDMTEGNARKIYDNWQAHMMDLVNIGKPELKL